MAQDPFLIDQVQIEPGYAGTRVIRNNAGAMEFVDGQVTGGITLLNLAGLKTMQNVLVVGKAGAGAAYTTIQSALDAVPASSSSSNPYLIWVGPGVYQENLNIVRDGVFIQGYGATLQSANEATPDVGAEHTVILQAALGTTPSRVVFTNLRITNSHTNYACVRIVGGASSTVGTLGIEFQDCHFEATSTSGNRPIWATGVVGVSVRGGGMLGSDALAMCLFENIGSLLFQDTKDIPAFYLTQDHTGDLPTGGLGMAILQGCGQLGAASSLSPPLSVTVVSSALTAGDLIMVGCASSSDAEFSGGVAWLVSSPIGDIAITDCNLRIRGSDHGTITSSGSSELGIDKVTGSVAFAGDTTKAIIFDTPFEEADYPVALEYDSDPGTPAWITGKSGTGFTVNFGAAKTLSVGWVVTRRGN